MWSQISLVCVLAAFAGSAFAETETLSHEQRVKIGKANLQYVDCIHSQTKSADQCAADLLKTCREVIGGECPAEIAARTKRKSP